MQSTEIVKLKSALSDVKNKINDLETIVNAIPIVTEPKRMKYHVWVYPGAPAMDAATTYRTNKIDVIRVEYFRLQPNGNLQQITEVASNLNNTKNGYSLNNVLDIKRYSSEQLVTVAGDHLGLRSIAASSIKLNTFVSTLSNFVVNNGLTGIDIDIEGFGNWTIVDYATYVNLLKQLGTVLRSLNKKLAICAPNWTTRFDNPPITCGWNWNEIAGLPIDYMTAMMYDWQWDYGGGAPISPLQWLAEWSDRLLKIFGPDRLVIGLPSYGYNATKGKWDITILTLDQIKSANGYDGAVRDPSSGEVFKTVGTKIFVSNDRVSLTAKLRVVRDIGVQQVSVWHAGGGNEWFEET